MGQIQLQNGNELLIQSYVDTTAPDRSQIISDLLIGLKRFRNVVRWKYFFAEQKRNEEELQDSPLSQHAFNT